ncbi:MAG: hypothetical protein BWX90_01149 [bacterium ADurb.Bin132]|nr:MAG: hypothetical protein BWX90_01149 [bacterium ADurb.Bin132]
MLLLWIAAGHARRLCSRSLASAPDTSFRPAPSPMVCRFCRCPMPSVVRLRSRPFRSSCIGTLVPGCRHTGNRPLPPLQPLLLVGGLQWLLQLSPQQSRKLSSTFQVSFADRGWHQLAGSISGSFHRHRKLQEGFPNSSGFQSLRTCICSPGTAPVCKGNQPVLQLLR